MRTIFETTTTLYPREDKNHYEVAADTIRSLYEGSPEFDGLPMSVSITEHPTGEATLNIKVEDPKLASDQENFKLVLWMLFIAIITTLIIIS